MRLIPPSLCTRRTAFELVVRVDGGVAVNISGFSNCLLPSRCGEVDLTLVPELFFAGAVPKRLSGSTLPRDIEIPAEAFGRYTRLRETVDKAAARDRMAEAVGHAVKGKDVMRTADRLLKRRAVQGAFDADGALKELLG